MTSETLVNIDQTTQRNNPEDGNLPPYLIIRLKNLTFSTIDMLLLVIKNRITKRKSILKVDHVLVKNAKSISHLGHII
jgi:hypothetical protein